MRFRGLNTNTALKGWGLQAYIQTQHWKAAVAGVCYCYAWRATSLCEQSHAWIPHYVVHNASTLCCDCTVIHWFKLPAMGEEHCLVRQEDRAETPLRGHTLWTTALPWPEQAGGREGDGRVTTDSGAGVWTDDDSTDNGMRQEINTDDESRHTVRELQQQGKHTQNCSFTNTRTEIKHETTVKSSKNCKYQLTSQWCKS